MTIYDIKKANRDSGSYWFSPEAMRFFRCRILPTVYEGPGGVFFVSSEQFNADSDRLYTVRRFNPLTGGVSTWEKAAEFNTIKTSERARTLARKAAKGEFGDANPINRTEAVQEAMSDKRKAEERLSALGAA